MILNEIKRTNIPAWEYELLELEKHLDSKTCLLHFLKVRQVDRLEKFCVGTFNLTNSTC